MTDTDEPDSLPPAVRTVPADPDRTLIEPVAWKRPERPPDPDRPPQMTAHPELQPGAHRRGGGLVLILVLVVLVGGGAAAAWYMLKPGHALPNSASLRLPNFKLPNLPFLQPRAAPAASAAPPSQVASAPVPVEAPPTASSQLTSESAAPASAAPSAALAMSAAPSAAPVVTMQPVQQAAAGLVSEARRSGLPSDQVAALASANNRLTVAANQAAAPGAPSNGAAAAALAMARSEAASLGRLAAARTREVDGMLGQSPVGDDAVDAVQRANANLTHWVSVAQTSRDPMTAINAARRAVGAWPAFNAAYVGATRYYAPAKRSEFWAVAGESNALAGRVVGFAANAKAGGLFATEGRRAAYEQMQSNAARAEAYLSQLNQLSQSERGETDLRRLDMNFANATAIKSSLANLYADSDRLYKANK